MGSWTLVGLGVVLGVLAGSALALFLVLSRSLRKARNLLIFGLGYVMVAGGSLGSLKLLLLASDRARGNRDDFQHHAAIFAYAISYGFIVFLAGRQEINWRKTWR